MLASLATILSLGLFSPSLQAPPRQLPGVEHITIHAPIATLKPLVVDALSASGVLLVDMASGQEIFSVNPETSRPIGSLTKLMTALLIAERHAPNDIATIAPGLDTIAGSTIGLRTGQSFRVDDLLRALLIPSANDAAYALALYDRGGIGPFVRDMNDRAAALGLRATKFANPAGFDNPDQYSSPRDLVWLTSAALRHPLLREIVRTRSARIAAFDGTEFSMRNTNELLQYNEDVFGVKTGTTDAAGECLIVLFVEGNRTYLLVILGSRDRYADSLALLKALHDALR